MIICLILPSFLECELHESRNHAFYYAWMIRKYSVNIYSFLQNQDVKCFNYLITDIVKVIC